MALGGWTYSDKAMASLIVIDMFLILCHLWFVLFVQTSNSIMDLMPTCLRAVPDGTTHTSIIAIMCVTVGIVCLSILVFVHRSSRQPIRFRSPWLVLAFILAVTLNMIAFAAISLYPSRSDCYMTSVYFSTFNLAFSLLCSRFWLLFFASRLQQDRLRLKEQAKNRGRTQTSVQESWFITHRHYASPYRIGVFLVLTNLVVSVPQWISVWQALSDVDVSRDNQDDAESVSIFHFCPVNPHWFQTVPNAVILIYCSVIAFFAIKLRNVRDSLFVKHEMTLLTSWTLVWFAGTNIMDLWARSNDEASTVGLCHYWSGLYLLGTAFISLVLPTLLTYAPRYNNIMASTHLQATAANKRAPGRPSLRKLLKTKEGVREFGKFLESEFSEENLLFFQDAAAFTTRLKAFLRPLETQGTTSAAQIVSMSSMSVYADARRLYDTFLLSGCPFEVNISSNLRNEIESIISARRRNSFAVMSASHLAIEENEIGNFGEEKVEQILQRLLEMFRSAALEIFMLMERDSFLRFCSVRTDLEHLTHTSSEPAAVAKDDPANASRGIGAYTSTTVKLDSEISGMPRQDSPVSMSSKFTDMHSLPSPTSMQ